jgi:hypothetical protein
MEMGIEGKLNILRFTYVKHVELVRWQNIPAHYSVHVTTLRSQYPTFFFFFFFFFLSQYPTF